MNKRGLSTIVTTLILILLVLVAIGIVWVVIRNVLSGGIDEISLGKIMIDLDIKSVQIDENNIIIKVKRNPGQGEIAGLKFVFSDGLESQVFEEKTTINELEEKTFIFNYDNLIEDISVAPILKTSSGKEKTGNIADEYLTGKKYGDEMIISPVNRNFDSGIGDWYAVNYMSSNANFTWEPNSIGSRSNVGKWATGSTPGTYYANLPNTYIKNLTLNKNYIISFDFYRPNGTDNIEVKGFIYLYNESSGFEILPTNKTNIPVDTWIKFRGEFNSSIGTSLTEAPLRIAPHIYSSTTPGESFYIDDVSVREVYSG